MSNSDTSSKYIEEVIYNGSEFQIETLIRDLQAERDRMQVDIYDLHSTIDGLYQDLAGASL